MLLVETEIASPRSVGWRTTYTRPAHASERSRPWGTLPRGSGTPRVIAAETRYMTAVIASAHSLPTVATSTPAAAGPKTLETTYPLLSIALARSPAALVFHERPGADLVEIQLAEGEPRAKRHRLRGDALSPHCLVTDGEAALAVTVSEVDPMDPGHADDAAVHLDRPGDHGRILGGLLEPFLL